MLCKAYTSWRGAPLPTIRLLSVLLALLVLLSPPSRVQATYIHHMKRAPLHYVNRRDDTRPIRVTNSCPETIYPGFVTQAGEGPSKGGFELTSGSSESQTVSADWQGRVWGRTNCSFNTAGTGTASNGGGPACTTGDCGSIVDCKATVREWPKSASEN